MPRFAPLASLALAALASLATSAPIWSVTDVQKGTERTERGEGLTLDVLIAANADALPEVDGGFAPQGMSGEDGLQSLLSVELELRTQGTLGIGREPTDVRAELWMLDTPEGDWIVDAVDVEVGLDAPAELRLVADGVLAHCQPLTPCEASLAIVLTQSGDAKLRVRYDALARVTAPMRGPAPREAELLVAVDAR